MDITTLISAAALVKAAQSCDRVAWLTDDNVIYATARRIVGRDVETASLEVTTVSGWEHSFPLMDLVEKYQSGLFVINPAPE